MDHAEKAVAFYNQKFNCSQGIFAAFAPELGIDEKTALKLGTNLGSGARSAQICGAVSGALLVLGLKYGHCEVGDMESKFHSYSKAEDFLHRFREKRGTIVCRELLGLDLTKPEDMKVIQEQNIFYTTCVDIVRCAAETLDEIMNEA